MNIKNCVCIQKLRPPPPCKAKSTQRTNCQSIAYFAYLIMKLTLIYVKVVKYFPFCHNFILDVPASSAQKNCCQEKCQQE